MTREERIFKLADCHFVFLRLRRQGSVFKSTAGRLERQGRRKGKGGNRPFHFCSSLSRPVPLQRRLQDRLDPVQDLLLAGGVALLKRGRKERKEEASFLKRGTVLTTILFAASSSAKDSEEEEKVGRGRGNKLEEKMRVEWLFRQRGRRTRLLH